MTAAMLDRSSLRQSPDAIEERNAVDDFFGATAVDRAATRFAAARFGLDEDGAIRSQDEVCESLAYTYAMLAALVR